MMNSCSLSRAQAAAASPAFLPFWRWRCRWSPIDRAVRRQCCRVASCCCSATPSGSSAARCAWLMRPPRCAARQRAAISKPASLAIAEPGRLGTIQKSVNDMLDITDAFVREASASMEYASRGKHFRKILVRGLPGSFRRSAATINSGTDSLGRRVVEIADLSKRFGTHLDRLPRPRRCRDRTGSRSGQMAAAAEKTSRETEGVITASSHASTNVATVASAAEQLASSIAEISRQVASSSQSTSRAVSEANRAGGEICSRRCGGADRRRRPTDQRDRRANQSARAQRHHRGGSRWRCRPRLRRGGIRGQEPCQPDGESDRGDQRQGRRDAALDDGVGRGGQAIAQTIAEIDTITATISSAIEQQGTATREIAHACAAGLHRHLAGFDQRFRHQRGCG